MPTYQTTGIVLGRTNFGEADRIIRLITPDRGAISAVAKGVRKIKSRAAGHLEPFGETTLMLATGKNLDVITSARLKWYPHELANDYARIQVAYMIATTITRLTEPDHPTTGLYGVVREALDALNNGANPGLVELWYLLRLADCLGYRPELMGCIGCGEHSPDANYFFDCARGGIVCYRDSTPDLAPMSIPMIKFWRLLTTYSYATIAQLPEGAHTAESAPLVRLFYQQHLGYSFERTPF